MTLQQWQAEVLEILNGLDDAKHFRRNKYTLSGFAHLMVSQECIASYETLRKFFGVLRDEKVIVRVGSRSVQGDQCVDVYTFKGRRALEFFADDFRETPMYQLVKRHATVFFD